MSGEAISAFNISSDNWFLYIEKAEKYFKDNNIDADHRLPALISLMGEEAYDLLDALASPKDPKTLPYEKATALLYNYLHPPILEARYKFFQRKQLPDEGMVTYAGALEKLAYDCGFEKSHRMENLRDQFIFGLANEVIRQKFFEDDCNRNPPKFYGALKIAKRLAAPKALTVAARRASKSKNDNR